MNISRGKSLTFSEVINALETAVNGCTVYISPCFNFDKKPTVCVRKARGITPGDYRADQIVTDDGSTWVVVGEIYNGATNERIDNMSRLYAEQVENLRVAMDAKTVICGTPITITLGWRNVSARYMISPETGLLVIAER